MGLHIWYVATISYMWPSQLHWAVPITLTARLAMKCYTMACGHYCALNRPTYVNGQA